LLASSLYRLAVNSYFVLHPSPHVMNNVNVPKYEAENDLHEHLSYLSQEAHELATQVYAGDKKAKKQLKQIESQVDEAAAKLWGLTPQELADVQASLKELKG
jgi:hypothetical protein